MMFVPTQQHSSSASPSSSAPTVAIASASASGAAAAASVASPSKSRRRSSAAIAANASADASAFIVAPDVAIHSLNFWDQSPASAAAAPPAAPAPPTAAAVRSSPQKHLRRSSFSRRLSLGTAAPSESSTHGSIARNHPPGASPSVRASSRSPTRKVLPDAVGASPKRALDISRERPADAPTASPARRPPSSANPYHHHNHPTHNPRDSSRSASSGGKSSSEAPRRESVRQADAPSERNSDSANRERRERDKKAMLSRALQKAHTAVVLDNAQNFEGAISAYGDACELLQQVLVRSSGEDDRRKLDSIRTTYTNRIQELHQLRSQSEQNADKSLPQPPSDTSPDGASPTPSLEMPDDDDDDEDDPVIIETAVMTRVVPDMSINPRSSSVLPDLLDSTLKDVEVGTLSRQDSDERFLSVESPMDASYLPPPLSPRRTNHTAADPPIAQSDPDLDLGDAILDPQISNETSVSWLDTIDESGGSSCASSVHSLTLGGLHRKHIRVLSGDTEAEFDAALDAAVEAAYDDGFEPYDNDHLAENRAVLSMRSESLGEDAYVSESSHEARGPPGQQEAEQDYESESDDHMEDARGYIDGFDFGLQSKSAPPRQSDSSTFSGNTWHSSISSSRTAATSLSTVAETVDSGLTLRANGSLPRLSEEEAQRDLPRQDSFVSQRTAGSGSGVRSRRMSGQNAKQLKIETAIPHVTKKPLPNKPEELGKPDEKADEQLLPSSVFKRPGPEQNQLSIPQTLTPLPAGSPVETAVTVSPATPALSFGDGLPLPASPGGKTRFAPRPLPLKKNKSSISLKNRTLSMSSPDGSDASLGTPMSTTFSFAHRGQKPASNLIPMISTPSAPTFATDIVPNTGVDLFESDLHSPYVPGTPNPLAANAPIPLEPCPDSHLLRPFWLMRCFYQTIAHPRGGYLSTKLFVPRDVWRVKGVKIKAVDDKISTCDLLTAALLKLASVDTLDADAVLDEMQAFEALLDQAQSNLSKKLGNDVGAHGLSTLFKDGASADGGNQAAEAASASSARTASTGRSYLTSWRKLRSKGSAVNLTSVPARDTSKDTYTMSTVPVTTLPNPRFAKRDLSQLDLSGPHALYMGSLARLFDAAQIIDQITRQAEDPGLKHSSPTHVGLELSTKRASDFFGFYVCRFVLQDLSMLLDKFIKRGSEWVLV